MMAVDIMPRGAIDERELIWSNTDDGSIALMKLVYSMGQIAFQERSNMRDAGDGPSAGTWVARQRMEKEIVHNSRGEVLDKPLDIGLGRQGKEGDETHEEEN